MTTRSEEERLGIVETQIEALSKAVEALSIAVQSRASAADVAEMRQDVKSIMQAQQQMALSMAVKAAMEDGHQHSRSDLGVWVRAAIPWIIAMLSLGFTIMHTLIEEQGV